MVLGYEIRHTSCHGDIGFLKCRKCKKTWNILVWLLGEEFYFIKSKVERRTGKSTTKRRLVIGLIAGALIVGGYGFAKIFI